MYDVYCIRGVHRWKADGEPFAPELIPAKPLRNARPGSVEPIFIEYHWNFVMLDSLSLKEQIAKTEHSETWVAFEHTKKKRLVLKRFLRGVFGGEERESRFEADAEAFEKLDGKHSVTLFPKMYFHGIDEQWLWFARESTGSDKSLHQWRQQGKLMSPQETAKRFALLAGLLGEMHAQSLVHRNVNPSTIYLHGSDEALLADPDIGHFLDPTAMKEAYQPQTLVAIDFLAPEQRRYDADAVSPDAQSDQWSLAACMVHAATGLLPSEYAAERLHAQLRPIVEQALHENPRERFPAMEEFRNALNHAAKKTRPTLFVSPETPGDSETITPEEGGFPPKTLVESPVESLAGAWDAVIPPEEAAISTTPQSVRSETTRPQTADSEPIPVPQPTPDIPSENLSQPENSAMTENRRPPRTTGPSPDAAARIIDLKCPQCGRTVVTNSRQCPQCNRPYEEPCLLCQAPNAFWMKYCKNCGTDLMATKHSMHERLYAQQQQIIKLRENYGHDKALLLLRQMSQVTHPNFVAIRDWAKNLFPIVQKERRDIKISVENVRMQARETLEAQMYDKVQQILSRVPAPLVDEEMRKMYAEAGECITEVDSLIREIRNSISSKQYNTLLSCVQRYLELKANDPDAKSLQEKIEKLTTVTSGGGIKLRRIPSGRFYMGSHESDEFIRNNERPQHRVAMPSSFFMSVYPVTQRDFVRVMEFNPSLATENEAHPVDNVTWFSAVEFCNKVSEEDGLSCYYDIKSVKRRSNGAIEYAAVSIVGGEGFRLPTEAEWEYTCRAGSITPWCFGDQILEVGQYAWYFDNAQGETQPVGMKKPNGWGLFDMHGNVMEWCYDWYGEFYYQQCGDTETETPIGPESGTSRSLRGGSWQFGAEATRSAYRNSCNPETSSSLIGFRIVRNTSEDEIT